MKDQNNPDNLTMVEISNSPLKAFGIFSIIYLIISTLISLLILSTGESFGLFTLIGLYLFYSILMCIALKFKPPKSRVLIDDRKINCFIQNNLCFEIKWIQIEEIIIYKEIRDVPKMRYITKSTLKGYSLNFKGNNLQKTIRLWCLAFGVYNQKKILNTIKNLSETKKIQLNVDDSFRPVITLAETPCQEYHKYYKQNK